VIASFVSLAWAGSKAAAQEDAPVRPVSNQTATRDAIDARAPEDRRWSALLARTKRSIERKEWNLAIQQLQGLLEQPSDAIVRVGSGSFRSMRAEAGTMLLSLPSEWKDRYRTQFGNFAQQALIEALEKSDYAAVADVATRYLLTDGGMRAARVMAERHMDRGEFVLAKRWFDRMFQFGYEPTTTLQKLQLAKAKKLAGLTPGNLDGEIVVGGREVQAAELLRQVQVPGDSGRSLDDWPMLMGTAARDGRSADRLPILVKNWTQPLVRSSVARDAATEIQRQVLTSQPAVIPAAVPIVVGSNVACRTPDGVAVFDSVTGDLLWRTEIETATQKVMGRPSPASLRIQTQYRSGENLLASFLFRDSVHGLIGSDNTRLFVIQDQPIISSSRIMWSRRSSSNPLANTNVLAAYNLKDGSIAWRIGGPPSIEQFRSSLAGYYFHGVPAAHLDELFVIAEKSSQLSLICLDASTGEQKWLQQLGFSDMEIGRDGARRHWVAQVTVANGLILCPTNADWLVAVDPLSRNIVWLSRYRRAGTAPASGTNRRSSRPIAPLSAQWPGGAPVIVGDTVVYTPTEVPSLVAVDFATGRQQWTQPKGARRYVAGVAGSNLIVAGTNFVESIRASDGQQQWKQLVGSGSIAGRGVLTGSHFHVPLSSGEIVSLSLESGDVRHRTKMARGSQLAANMVMHTGGTLLQTPTDLEAFVLRPPNGVAPSTPSERLRAAEILLADGKTDEALRTLEAIESSQLGDGEQGRRNTAIRDCLQRRIERGSESADVDLKRLQQLGMQPAELARLAILSGTAQGEFERVFRQLAELHQSPGQEPVLGSSGQVRRDVWVATRLHDAFTKLDPSERESVNDFVKQIRETGGAEELDRFLDAFGFHPAARDGLNERFATLLSAGRFAEAESDLVRFRRFWPERVPHAAAELATALADVGQRRDAVALLKSYGLEDKTGDLPAAVVPDDSSPEWTDAIWQVRQFGMASRGTQSAERLIYHPDIQYSHDTVAIGDPANGGRLHFQDVTSGALRWTLSLGGRVQAVIPNGRTYLIVLRDRLVAVAPLERRWLWEQPINLPGVYWARVFQPLVPPTGMYSNDRPPQLPITNQDYVCYRDQQSLRVLDAATGAIRWSRDDVAPGARVFGTTEVVMVVDGEDTVRVFRSRDGKDLGRVPPQAGVVTGMGPNLICRTSTGLPLFRTLVLRSVDPTTGDVSWRHRFSGEPTSARVNDSQIVVRHGNRKLTLIDLASGETTEFEASTPFPKGQYSVAVTARHVLMVNTGEEVTLSRSASQAVEKEVRVFDRRTGEQIWNRGTKNAKVATRWLQWMPVLVLMENSQTTNFDRIGALDVWDTVLLDVATGKELISQSMSTRVNRSEVLVDYARRFIEIATASRRYRFDTKQPRTGATPKRDAVGSKAGDK